MKGMRLIVTYNCNIMCSHCEYKCGPHKKGFMDVKNFKSKFIESYNEGYNDYIIIQGGEIMTHTGIVYKYLKNIAEYDIEKRLVTNGFWGELEIYPDILVDLREKGASTLIFEYDYFHSLYINIRTLERAIKKALDAEFKVQLMSSFLTNNISCEIDNITFNFIKYIKKHFQNVGVILNYINKDSTSNEEKIIEYK